MTKILKATDNVMLYKENSAYCVSVENKDPDCFKEKELAEAYYQHQIKRFN